VRTKGETILALTIFHQLVILLALLAVGWLLVKTGRLQDEKQLVAIITNAALPALVIVVLQAPFSPGLLRDIGITALGFVVIMLAGVGVGMLALAARRPLSEVGVWAVCITAPNSVFVGWPITYAIYGSRVMPLTAGIVVTFNLFVFVVGAWLVSLGKERTHRPNIKALMLQPTIIAVIVGVFLFLMPFRLPATALSLLDLLALMATPLSMIVIGCQLARCNLRETFLDAKVYIVVAARLVVTPLVAFLLLRMFVSDPIILGVLVIAACMPVGTSVAVIAAEQNSDAPFCSKAVLVSTVLCILSVPVLVPLLLGT